MSNENTSNKNIVLIVGKPSCGKSTSLMNMPDQENKVYFNTDLKELPFKSKFKEVFIKNPYDIIGGIHEVEQMENVDAVVLDTLTFLMSQFHTQYVADAANGQKAWGDYGIFYKKFIHAIKSGTKDYAILAHTKDELNELTMSIDTVVPIQGAVGKQGVEADFSTILAAKKVPIKELKDQENDLLHITENDIEDGFKHVFVTRVDKNTTGEKMRSAIGLWDRKEKYIDNDLAQVFNRLHQYYS